MSVRLLKAISKPFSATAVPIHDGTNSQGYPHTVEGFAVQARGDTYFGEATVTDETNGFLVKKGDGVNILGFLSRGSPFSYDLTKIYYIGGPWTMTVETPR